MSLRNTLVAFGISFAAGALVFSQSGSVVAAALHEPAGKTLTRLADGSVKALNDAGSALGATPAAPDTTPRDFSHLLKVDDLTIHYDDSVSLQPISQARVEKIGFGQRSTVKIVTTSSGIYSTDGLNSPQVHYTGMEVEKVQERDPNAVMWARGFGWVAIPVHNSIVTFGRITGGGRFINRGDSTCVTGAGFASCG